MRAELDAIADRLGMSAEIRRADADKPDSADRS